MCRERRRQSSAILWSLLVTWMMGVSPSMADNPSDRQPHTIGTAVETPDANALMFDRVFAEPPIDAWNVRPPIDLRAPDGCDLDPDDPALIELDATGVPRGVQAGLPWPNGVVHYVFGANTTPEMQAAALEAMDELASVAQLTFLPATQPEDGTRIAFWDSDRNSSPIGYAPSITLQGSLFVQSRIIRIYNWNNIPIIMHEIMHSLSIKHEQSRSDRDNFVEIVGSNIKSNKSHNFSKTSGPTYGNYDFESVMHYGNCAFSDCENPGCTVGVPSNGIDPPVPGAEDCYTIRVKPPFDAYWNSRIGQRSRLSHGDVETLRAIYGHRWAHDECDHPELIAGEGTFAFDNRYATESGIGAPACFFNGDTSIDRDVWYRWTATADGVYRLDSCYQSNVNSKIAVYATGVCPSQSDIVACDDDGCGSINATMTFAAVAGQQFMIQVGLAPVAPPQIGQPVRIGGTGTFTIDLEVFNNTCEQASHIGGNNLTIPYDNTLATETGVDNAICDFSGFTGIEHDLWYIWTAPKSGAATLSTCGLSAVDTKVAVYSGTSCPEGFGIVACNDDACGVQSAASWAAQQGDTYLLRVGVYENATPQPGMFNVRVQEFPDHCGLPEDISGVGVFDFDTRFATNSNSINDACGAGIEFESDVWYRWSTDTTSIVTVRTCGLAAMDTVIGVYDDCPDLIDSSFGISHVIVCGDNECGLQSEVQFRAIAGQQYLFRVGSKAGTPGEIGQFQIQSTPFAATNDDCQDAIVLEGDFMRTHGTFAGSSWSGFSDDCNPLPENNDDVYYTWTSPGIGTVQIHTCGSSDYPDFLQGPNTTISVHSSCPAASGNMIACNNTESANDPRFCAASGTTYRDAGVSLAVTTGQTIVIRVAKSISGGGADDFFLTFSYVGLPQIVDRNVLIASLQPGPALANLVLLNPLDGATNELVAGMPLTDPGDLPPSVPFYPFDDQIFLHVVDDGNVDILNLFTSGIESSGTHVQSAEIVAVVNHEEQFSVFDNPTAVFADPGLLENPSFFGSPVFAQVDQLQSINPLILVHSQGFVIDEEGGEFEPIPYSLSGLVGNAVSAAMPMVAVQGGAQTLANNYPLVILDQGGAGFLPGLLAVDFETQTFERIDADNWSFEPNTMTSVPGESDAFYIAGGPGAGRGANVAQVIRFSLDGTTEVVSAGGDLVNPTDIAVEADGNLLVADPDAFGGLGAVIRIYVGQEAADDNDPNADPPSGDSPAGDQFVVALGNNTIGDLFIRPVGVSVIRCETLRYSTSTYSDLADVNPGDGEVLTGMGNRSLRAAVMEANASPCPGGVMIQLAGSEYNFGLPGMNEDSAATGDLDITGYVRIRGAGMNQTIISAQSLDRVLEVHPGATLALSDLRIVNGSGDGAGIRNRGNLAMLRVRVSGNTGAGGAGGIRNDGTMLAIDCEFDNNSSTANGGAIGSFGTGANTTMLRCLVRDNTTNLNGAGVAIGSQAALDMENCTVSRNTAAANGAGIFSNNGFANLNHCTVAFNMADSDMNGVGDGGGLGQFGGAITIANSIVGFNTRNGNIRSDLAGTITSGGYNNIRQVSPGFIVGDLSGNVTGFGATLQPLADNGGVTMTHALAPGSIGIDDANPDVCITFDQRHKFRPYDGDADSIVRCDMGAYEFRGRKGDVNCDGTINGLDVQAFVLAALNPSFYSVEFPGCDLNNADVDENGVIEALDVAALVPLLTNP